MEATRVREEWEHAISSKENANSQPSDDDASSDAYCFELLSMVLALSGSNVGRQYLAQQLTLMQDLFSLLHTASPRVQRQVGEDVNKTRKTFQFNDQRKLVRLSCKHIYISIDCVLITLPQYFESCLV